jgi:hypothetical protein
MKRSALILAAIVWTGLAPTVRAQTAESAAPAEAPAAAEVPGVADASTPPAAAAGPTEPSPKNFRIGFWEIDFFAVDQEPRGSTFRFLDFKIFRLLEVGQGTDYQAFGLFEMPELLSLFASRREGSSRELRVFDVQAIALALVRQIQTNEGESQTHILKLPVIGSVVSFEVDEEQPEIEHQTYLFLIRRDVKRGPATVAASRSPTPP